MAVLNRTGKLAKPPQELVEVLAEANRISKFTNGAFDVSVKPLVDLYQDAQPDLPDADAVEAALGLVDHTKVTVTSDEISFSQPGMAVTLDGIAKGYIVDAGAAVLRWLGFANVFVEAGGDLMACGKKEGDASWKVGVQSPRKEHSGLMAKSMLVIRQLPLLGITCRTIPLILFTTISWMRVQGILLWSFQALLLSPQLAFRLMPSLQQSW